MQKLELIIKEGRPTWFGHILRWMMADCRNKLRIGRRTLRSNGREN